MSTEISTPSASYAAEVTRLLWPEPWSEPQVTRTRKLTPTRREVYLFPSESNPRLLLPADLPQSSVMIQRLGGSRAGWSRPARRALERSVGSRVFPLVGWPRLRVAGADPAADSIERHLSQSLDAEVRVGIVLGTRRVNQKPVLQVFGDDGTVLGYAKIGHNPLTAQLVRQEAHALRSVAASRPRTFASPQVLHHDQWRGLEVLVMSALVSGGSAAVGKARRLAAAREVIDLGGRTCARMHGSVFAKRLVNRAAGLAAPGTDGERLRDAVARLTQQHGDAELQLGGWHGDWGHWNMGLALGELQIWDWERHETDVPVGFDELHFLAQSVRPEGRAVADQERALLEAVDARLGELGVPSEIRHLTFLLYLAEMATRYLEALQLGATPILQLRTRWVISLLEHQLPHSRTAPKGAS